MVLIIAEAGENHLGDRTMARQLVGMAASSGADYVKFQMYSAAKAANDDPEKEWFGTVEVSEEMWQDLVDNSKALGIEPLCTPWDIEKAEIIYRSGVNTMKIASFHTTDLELLDYVNERSDRVFISTGMSSVEEIDRAVNTLNKVDDLYVLHCVSEYPLPPENVNLRIIQTLKDRYGSRAKIGYSDHTTGILSPVAAVAMGADAIEKHVTLSKDLEGTDHILSADAVELPEMVREIRLLEIMMGSPEKRITALEAENQDFLRNRFRH